MPAQEQSRPTSACRARFVPHECGHDEPTTPNARFATLVVTRPKTTVEQMPKRAIMRGGSGVANAVINGYAENTTPAASGPTRCPGVDAKKKGAIIACD